MTPKEDSPPNQVFPQDPFSNEELGTFQALVDIVARLRAPGGCPWDREQTHESLKRHLRTKYDMTPEEYREKWGLPGDYPMVAPGYSKQRSMLAKQMGLGKSERD